jgi:predicted dehydrogenase
MKAALIGCGAVAQNYYQNALLKLEKAGRLKVQALLDPDPSSISKFQKIFPSAGIFKTVSDISKNEADLAIVASPPCFHAWQTTTLLKAGVAVLCEKPMAVTAAQAEEMVEASEKGALLAISHPRRFLERTREIKDTLSKRALGKVVSFLFVEGTRFSWPGDSDTFFKKTSSGGGVFMDLGPHALDLLFWWLGQPLEIRYEDDAMGGVEANAILKCRFKEGFEGKIHLSREFDLPGRYEIECQKGRLVWDLAGMDVARMIESQLCAFIDALGGEKNNCAPARETLETARWTERCYKNARLISMPWLPLEEASAAVEMRR